MKNLTKRIVVMIIMATMVLSVFSVFSVFAVDNSEVATSISEEQAGLLRYLGILTEKNPKYNKELTRGEFARIAAKVSNQPEYMQETVLFHDVPAEHPYFQDIHALAVAGIVSGDGDGYYRPDEPVSDAEACKIFTVILGWKVVGYIEGYYKTARSIGLTDGISMDGTVSYGDALAMAYNTLHTEMFEPVSFGDETEYRVKKGYYALERYFNLVRMTGKVDGISGSTLTHPNSAIETGYISIGGRQYLYDDESLIGQNVVYYCEPDDFTGGTKNQIAYLYADPDKNQTITILDKDIIGKSGNSFRYWQNGSKREVVLERAIDLIYNGVAYPKYKDEDWILGTGRITLINNDNDNLYDVAVIDAYEYVVCRGVDRVEQLIYCEYPQTTIGVPGQDKILELRTEKGKQKIDNLKYGDVLAVQQSKNTEGARKINALVLNSKGLAAVTGISDKTVKIGEDEYFLTDATVIDRTIKVGETVSLYLHNDSCAVILHASNDSYQFGYLVDATTKDTAFSSTLKVKIVDGSRQLQEYNGIDKIKVDESVFTDGTLVLGRLREAAAKTYQNDITEWKYSQPVRYRLNDEGYLTHLDTLFYDTRTEDEDSLQLYKPAESDLRYSWACRSLITQNEAVFNLPDTSKMFMVATSDRDKPDWYGTVMTEGMTYTAEGYNVDPGNLLAEYAIVYTASEKSINDSNSAFHIVGERFSELDQEGYPVERVTMISPSGTRTAYAITDEAKNVSFAEGDIVRFAADADKNITALEVSFAISKGAENTRTLAKGNSNNGMNMDRAHRISYGTILYFKDDLFNHTSSVDTDEDFDENKKERFNYRKSSATKFFVYDSTAANPKVEAAVAADVIPYSMDPKAKQRAVMFTQSGALSLVYILK